MRIMSYEEFIDFKRLTPKQHKKKMELYKERFGIQENDNDEEVIKRLPGRCSSCGNASFTLFLENRELVRKCKQCDTLLIV